jgi:hypothetical protein
MTQSNEPTIDQMNEAIALFMGYERYEDHSGIWFKRIGMIKCMHPKLQELNYHTSWDWLMPVWKQLTERVAALTEEGDYPADFSTIMDMYAYHCEQVDITAAHDIVYKGIQWFNKNKPNGE